MRVGIIDGGGSRVIEVSAIPQWPGKQKHTLVIAPTDGGGMEVRKNYYSLRFFSVDLANICLFVVRFCYTYHCICLLVCSKRCLFIWTRVRRPLFVSPIYVVTPFLWDCVIADKPYAK